MEDKNIKNVVKNSYIVLSLSLIGVVMGYVLRIFLSKYLPIEDFGLFYAVSAFVGLFALVRYLGLNYTLTKYIPEFLVKNEKGKIKSSIVLVVIIQSLTILAFLAFIFLFQDTIIFSFFKTGGARPVLILIALSLLPSMFFAIFQAVFQGYQELKKYASIEPLRIFLTLVFSFLLIGMGATGVALAYLIAACITTIVFFHSFYNLGFAKAKTNISRKFLENILKFSIPVFIGSFALVVINSTDTLALTYFRSLKEVGLYQIALPTSQLLLFFSSSVLAVAFPLISELYAKKRLNDITKGLTIITVFLSMILMPFVIALVTFPDVIIQTLFSSEFLPAIFALQILSVGMIFFSLFTVFQTVLDGMGHPSKSTKTMFIMAGLNLVLDIILVPQYGIAGSATAALVAYSSGMLISYAYIKRLIKVSIPIHKLAKIFGAASVSVFLISIIRYTIHIPVYQQLTVSLLFGWILYALLIVFSKSLTSDDIKFIESKGVRIPDAAKKLVKFVVR